jgi:hypothetical protein
MWHEARLEAPVALQEDLTVLPSMLLSMWMIGQWKNTDNQMMMMLETPPQYMLPYDPHPWVFNLAHAMEEAREEGDSGNSDEQGDVVLLYNNAHLEVDQ